MGKRRKTDKKTLENKNIEISEVKKTHQKKIRDKKENPIYAKYKFIIWIAIILLFTIIAYSTAFDNDFLNWDDDRYVTGNEHITELSAENIKTFFTEPYFVMYMPFTLLSYSVDYAIGGLNSYIFHSHNILLHLINTILVFFFIYRLILLKKPKFAFSYALIVSLLFGVHTFHIQSVTWIAERKDVLYALYFILSLILYVKYIETKKLKFILFSLFAFLISVMSKGQAVALSLSIVAVDILLSRKLLDKKVIFEKIPYFVISGIFGVVALIAAGGEEPFAGQMSSAQVNELVNRSFFENIIYAASGFTIYLFKTLIPNNLSLLHAYPIVDKGEIPAYIWLYTIPIPVIIAIFIYSLKKSKELAFGILFFTLNLVLVLQIISDQPFFIAEHYSYISSIGIFFLFGLAYQKITEHKKEFVKPAMVLFFGYIIFLTGFTYVRNDIFQNSETVWTDVIKQYPQTIIAYYNRGNYYQKLGDEGEAENYKKAINDYTEAIKLNPKDVAAFSNRGITKGKTGDTKGALADFNKVVEIDSTFANVYSNRGNAKVMSGKYQSAISDYTKAIKERPDFIDAIYNRGLAYANIGQFENAISDLDKAIKTNPKNLTALLNRAVSYYSLKKYELCKTDCNNILKLNPKEYNALFYLGQIEENKGNPEEARRFFDKVNKLKPDFVKTFTEQGQYFESKGQYNTALQKYKRAVEINPNYADTYVNIGVLYGKTGDLKKAIEFFNIGIKTEPTNFKAFSNRAYAYQQLGNTEQALNDYSSSLKINPNFANTYYNRGVLYNNINKAEKAIQDFNKAIQIDPKHATAILNRGIAYAKSGQNENACKDFNNALNLGLKNAQFYINKYCKK